MTLARPATDKYDPAKSIELIERILTAALPVDKGVTPGQFEDLMEMYITDMHLRKVTGDFWMEMCPLCAHGIKLAERMLAESRLYRTPDLPEGVMKTIAGAIELSLQEISDLRAKLLEKLELLKKCANPGDKIH